MNRPERFAATLCALFCTIGPTDRDGVDLRRLEQREQAAMDALNKSVAAVYIHPTKPASLTVRLNSGEELEVTIRRVFEGDQ